MDYLLDKMLTSGVKQNTRLIWFITLSFGLEAKMLASYASKANMVSALGSRVGWTPTRKERTNERL